MIGLNMLFQGVWSFEAFIARRIGTDNSFFFGASEDMPLHFRFIFEEFFCS